MVVDVVPRGRAGVQRGRGDGRGRVVEGVVGRGGAVHAHGRWGGTVVVVKNGAVLGVNPLMVVVHTGQVLGALRGERARRVLLENLALVNFGGRRRERSSMVRRVGWIGPKGALENLSSRSVVRELLGCGELQQSARGTQRPTVMHLIKFKFIRKILMGKGRSMHNTNNFVTSPSLLVDFLVEG